MVSVSRTTGPSLKMDNVVLLMFNVEAGNSSYLLRFPRVVNDVLLAGCKGEAYPIFYWQLVLLLS